MIENARWGDIYTYFAAGNPPLVLQMLAFNTICMLIFIYRRAKAKHRMHHHTIYAIQGLFIAANLAVMFQKDVMLFVKSIQSLA